MKRKPLATSLDESSGASQAEVSQHIALREFSRSLPMLLLRSHQAVMAEFRPILREHGIVAEAVAVIVLVISDIGDAVIRRAVAVIVTTDTAAPSAKVIM